MPAKKDTLSTSDARIRLIQAAEHLFAREGVERAQIQAITQLAGQRNTSALHYYFGSREGLIRAVFDRHLEDIEPLRARPLVLLQEVMKTQQRAEYELHELVEILVLPLASKLRTPEGRNYLLMLQQCVGELHIHVAPAEQPPSMQTLHGFLRAALQGMPKPIIEERIRFVIRAMTATLAERVRAIEIENAKVIGEKAFVANLIAMLYGALAQPHGVKKIS